VAYNLADADSRAGNDQHRYRRACNRHGTVLAESGTAHPEGPSPSAFGLDLLWRRRFGLQRARKHVPKRAANVPVRERFGASRARGAVLGQQTTLPLVQFALARNRFWHECQKRLTVNPGAAREDHRYRA
jgi:hypothetical protein